MYFKHNAIIVTGRMMALADGTLDATEDARKRALTLFPEHMVSETVTSAINGFKTFLIGPSGYSLRQQNEKPDEEEERYEKSRKEFVEWLEKQEWVEYWTNVSYGDAPE